MRCTTCSRSRPKSVRACVCVCVPGLTLGGAAACPLESRGSCMRAARESRVAGTLRGGYGELRLATTARSYSWLRAVRCSRGVHAQPAQSRPPNACPYRAIPHRLQAAAAQRGRRRRHRHGHRHVIATGPPSGVAVLCAQRSVLGRGRLGAGEPVRSRDRRTSNFTTFRVRAIAPQSVFTVYRSHVDWPNTCISCRSKVHFAIDLL